MSSAVGGIISWIDFMAKINLATDNVVKLTAEYQNANGTYNYKVIAARVATLVSDLASFKNAYNQNNLRKEYDILKKYNPENFSLLNNLKTQESALQKMNIFFQTVGMAGSLFAEKDLTDTAILQRFGRVLQETGNFSGISEFNTVGNAILVGELTQLRPVMQAVFKEMFNLWYQANFNIAEQVDMDNLDYEDIPEKYEDDPIFSLVCLSNYPQTHSISSHHFKSQSRRSR